MSHATHRLARAVLLIAALALAGLPSTALAKPKAKPKPPCPHANKGGSPGKKCGRPKPTKATPVNVVLIDGSVATVDIPQIPLPGGGVIPGTPTTRSIALTGSLTGSIPVYNLGKDNTLAITGGAIGLGAEDLLDDPGCAGASILKLDPASNVGVDKAQPSSATIFADGRVQASVHVLLNLAFDSRQSTACDGALVPMGTSQTALPVTVKGMIEKGTGLTALKLDSDPIPTSVAVCLTPGTPGTPCSTPPVAYPVTITVHPVVKVAIG